MFVGIYEGYDHSQTDSSLRSTMFRWAVPGMGFSNPGSWVRLPPLSYTLLLRKIPHVITFYISSLIWSMTMKISTVISFTTVVIYHYPVPSPEPGTGVR